MREGFILYRSFFEALSELSDEQKGKCLSAISEYALYGNEPNLTDPVVRLFYTMAKPQIDANNKRFENGRKGGRPKTEVKPKENQNITKDEPKEKEKEKEKDKVKDNVNVKENNNLNNNIILSQTKKFKKPTVEEINTYCTERKNTISAEDFYNFYESKGWKIGSSPMKDWKAAVRTWEHREREKRTWKAAQGLFGVESGTYGKDIPL